MISLKRDIYSELFAWKKSGDRKPLVLQGARQVGKTFILKEFGKNEYIDYAYFNFEKNPDLTGLFQGKKDPGKIVENLSIYSNKKIEPVSTLIIFDEVQNSPATLTCLKYFCETHNQYHIIATGSLLGISLFKNQISSFPVGKVNFLQLFPLSFSEFLISNKEEKLREFLDNKKNLDIIPEVFHKKLLEYLKIYYYTGGMPEALVKYITSKDYNSVRTVQKNILTAYSIDVTRYASRTEAIKISNVWDSIPNQLTRENKKFKYSEIDKNAKSREYRDSIQWLIDAGVVYKSYNISIPELPLSAFRNNGFFKLFLVDVGLLGALLNLSPKTIIEGNKLFTYYNGAFAENYAAQELIVNNFKELYYWTSGNTAEVDFIVSYDDRIFPLEVKSGLNTKAKSLKIYEKKYSPEYLTRSSQRNFNQTRNICDIPLYAISIFPGLYKL